MFTLAHAIKYANESYLIKPLGFDQVFSGYSCVPF